MGSSHSRTVKDIKKNDAGKSELDYSNTTLTEAQVIRLVDAMRDNSTLTKVNFTNTNLSDVSTRYLCNMLAERALQNRTLSEGLHKSITVLILDTNPIGPDGGKYLVGALEKCYTLETVKLNNCALGDVGAISVARSLINNDHIHTLEIGNNLISDRGAREFGEMLRRNNRLEGLSLWKNNILASGAAFLAQGLLENRSLQWLGLGGNGIGPDGALAFASRLGNIHLRWLALGGNGVQDQGAMVLASALKDDGCDLQSIGLGGNEITDRGIQKLARALWTNTRLLSLGLGGNLIGSEGCEHLGEMLRTNTHLTKLILSSNDIDDDGIRAIADGLGVNTTLHTLLLAANTFTNIGANYLGNALVNNNKTLRVLDLHESDMTEQGEQELVDYLRKDSCLELLGSHFGPRDHRIVAIQGEANMQRKRQESYRQQAQVAVNNYVVDNSVPTNMREHEVF
eukprot:m.240315 g.240315  ORF g.240315 m.240315 type:complete len:455 (+) comp14869_c0_seq1:76-1440(+)